MCIFLCLSQTQLCLSICCQKFTKCIANALLLERNQLITNSLIIICKAHINQRHKSIDTVKLIKTLITKCTCNLTCPIRTEIKEDYGIIGLDCRKWLAIFLNNRRHHKFIIYILCIRICHGLYCIICFFSLTCDKRIISFLNAVPVIITVHCIIAPMNARNFSNANLVHLFLKLFHKTFSRCWRGIPSIQECVDIYIFYPIFLCQLQQSIKMCIMAVNAAIRQKPV